MNQRIGLRLNAIYAEKNWMNDFTKEELEFIYRNLERLKWHKTSYMMSKIQSMIDNYCDHDSHETSALIDYCHKCDNARFKLL